MVDIKQLHKPIHKKPKKETKTLLSILFVVLPFVDALNGFLVVNGFIPEGGVFSPSQLARMLLSLYLVVFLYNRNVSKVLYFFILYIFLVEVVASFFHLNLMAFIFGAVYSYKITYLILLYLTLNFMVNDEQDIAMLCKYIYYNLLIIAVFLFFSSVTGLGNSTYGHGFGTKSFFSSGNGLGLYLGVFTFFLIAMKHINIIKIQVYKLAFISCSIALIGSKAALLLCVLNLFLIVYLSRYRYIFLGCVLAFIYYMQNEFSEAFSLLFDVIITRFENAENIWMYLGSGRIEYIVHAYDIFMAQIPSPGRVLFGMGAFTSFQNPSLVMAFDTLETDLFDLFFMYGFLFTFLYFLFFAVGVIGLRKHKLLLCCFTLLYLHSILAGHVLFNGMSSIPLVVLFLMSKKITAKETDGAVVTMEKSID